MEVFEEPRNSQNGVTWTQHALKNIKKALVKQGFRALEKAMQNTL